MENIDRTHINQRSLEFSVVFKSIKVTETKMFENH